MTPYQIITSKRVRLAVQAAVGMKQLERIDALIGSRQKNGSTLDQGLIGTPGLLLPEYPEGAKPIYMSFVVHHSDRDKLAETLRNKGVDTTVGYMNNMSDHPLFQEYRSNCPNATKANEQLLHLPVHPNLTPKDLNHMIHVVREACTVLS